MFPVSAGRAGQVQSSLPFLRPPPGFGFFISNGSRGTSVLGSARLCHREGSAGDPHCLGQAGSCLSPLAAQTPAPAAAGKPCSKNPAQTLQQKLHSHSSAAHCRAVHTELPAGFLSPFSPGCPYRGEGTKCCCALLRWVMVPKGGADTDKAPRNSPAASSTFLFPNQFKHSHFSSGRCF